MAAPCTGGECMSSTQPHAGCVCVGGGGVEHTMGEGRDAQRPLHVQQGKAQQGQFQAQMKIC
jgi:hypothetical protein